MANPLSDQLQMFDYWVEAKGLDRTLAEYAPDVAKDPAVQAATIQMYNAENALLARVEELKEQFLEEI